MASEPKINLTVHCPRIARYAIAAGQVFGWRWLVKVGAFFTWIRVEKGKWERICV